MSEIIVTTILIVFMLLLIMMFIIDIKIELSKGREFCDGMKYVIDRNSEMVREQLQQLIDYKAKEHGEINE
jgi:hypothetical protein